MSMQTELELPIASLLEQAMGQHLGGDYVAAEVSYRQILSREPRHLDALSLLGMLCQATGRVREALALMNAAIDGARHPLFLSRRAALFLHMREANAALEDAKHAVKLDHQLEEAQLNLIAAYRLKGDTKKAAKSGKEALGIFPTSASIWNNYGAAIQDQGDYPAALDAFEQALVLDKDNLRALENAAKLLWGMGQVEQAAVYSARAYAQHSCDADVLWPWLQQLRVEGKNAANNGLVRDASSRLLLSGQFEKVKRLTESINFVNQLFELASYFQGKVQWDRSHELLLRLTELDPLNGDVWNNLGVSYFGGADPEKALDGFIKAAQINPGQALIHRNIGVCHFLMARPEEARRAYEKALELEPGSVTNLLYYFGQSLLCCEWSRYAELKSSLIQATLTKDLDDLSASMAYLQVVERAVDMRVIAGKVGRSLIRYAPLPSLSQETRSRPTGGKLRVGYLSYDFRDHPVTYLTEDLYGLHDRSRFEVIALSYGPDDGSAYLKRVVSDADEFVDMQHMSKDQMIEVVRGKSIDILVDLTGNTRGNRSSILGARLAPVQCHWLGYVWSMGHTAYDYVIADPYSIPPEFEHGYTEKPARLPYTLQICPGHFKPSSKTFSRRDFGLPDDALVLCNFGSFGKLQPELFGAWMRILQALPQAVLWMARTRFTPKEAFARLRDEVTRHGVDPDRVLFSEPLSREEHLRRYELADLALDTYPQGSGTTAIEGLYMGCPMISMAGAGETLAIRMAGSILNAAGLPDLVVNNLQEYEALAIELGQNPLRLAHMRQHLTERRQHLPLFDTPQTVRYLEACYEKMWTTHCEGLPPQAFTVQV